MAAVVTREADILTPDTLPPPWGAPVPAEPESDPTVSIEIRREPVSGYVPTAEASVEAHDSEPPPILSAAGALEEAPAPEEAPAQEAAAEEAAPRAEDAPQELAAAPEPPAAQEPPAEEDAPADVRDSELAPALPAEIAEAKKESAPPPPPEPEPEPEIRGASAAPVQSAEPQAEEAKEESTPPPLPPMEAKPESAPPPPVAEAKPEPAPKIEPAAKSEPAKPAPAVAAPSRNGVRYVAVAVAVVAGLCIGVFSNQQSVKGPTRELGERVERVEATRVEMRADLQEQKAQIKSTQDQVKQLSARVDAESAARKSDHAKLERDMTTLHENVKKQNASTEARIQRLREALTEMEMIQDANATRPSKK